MHVGILCAQGKAFDIPLSWVLLDTCSTCDISNNPGLVKDIHTCRPEDRLTAYTNGGVQVYSKIADLKLFPIKVHFKKSSMATILSLKTVSAIPGARLHLDTATSTDITLTLSDGSIFIFKKSNNGLYFYDTSVDLYKPKPVLHNYSFLQTVTENKTYFSRQEIKGADTSRKLQEYLYYPGTTTYKDYVSNSQINNCVITPDDVNSQSHLRHPSPLFTRT